MRSEPLFITPLNPQWCHFSFSVGLQRCHLCCLEKPSKSLKTECISDLQVSPSGFSRPFLKPFQHRLHFVMSCAETWELICMKWQTWEHMSVSSSVVFTSCVMKPLSYCTMWGTLEPDQCSLLPIYFHWPSGQHSPDCHLHTVLLDLSVSNNLTWFCASTQLCLGPLLTVSWT